MNDDLPLGFRVVGTPAADGDLPAGFRVVSGSPASTVARPSDAFTFSQPPPGAIVHGGDGRSYLAGHPDVSVSRTAPPGSGEEAALMRALANSDPDAWRRGTIAPVEKNVATGEFRSAVPQIALDAWDAFSLPGDVYEGKVDPTSPAGIKRAVDLAGFATGGAVSAPSRALVDEAGRAVPRAVMRGLRDDGIAFSDVASRVAELGPEGRVADLGPNLRDKAAALATTPGRAQSTVVDQLRERQRGAPSRLTDELDEALGLAPVPSYVQRDIRAGQREIGPEYDAVLANAAPVDTSALAIRLDGAVANLRGKAQTELQSVRTMLNEVGSDNLDRSAATLHQVRRALDGMLNAESDGNVRRVLGQTRTEIDGILASAVPGIKEIDARYAELGRQHNAVDRGQTVLGSGRTDPRPAELADEAAAGVTPNGDVVGPSGVTFRLRQGARAEIDRLVGTNLNDRAALTSVLKGESDWNRQRLSTLFGEDRTERLYRLLENERAMAETENKALAGAKTASLHAAQREIDGPPRRAGIVRSAANLRAGDAAAELLDAIFRGAGERRRTGRNEAIADALMSRGQFRDPGRTVPLNAGIPAMALIDLIMGDR